MSFKTADPRVFPFQNKHHNLLHGGSELVTDSLLVDLGIGHGNYIATASLLNRRARPVLAPVKVVELRAHESLAGAFYLETKEAHKNDTNQVAVIAAVATAAALPAVTQSGAGVGATLTADAVGLLFIDGVLVELNDIVLIKDQAAGADNGIYTCTTEGEAGVAFILTRTTAHDADAEVTSGDWTVITGGATQAGLGAVISTTGAITVDTTAVVWDTFDWTDIQVSFQAQVGDASGF